MVLADLQRLGDGREIVAAAQARGAQILPDRLQRRIAVAGNLAQMDAAALHVAAVVERQIGSLWSSRNKYTHSTCQQPVFESPKSLRLPNLYPKNLPRHPLHE